MGSSAPRSALLVDDNAPVRWITEEILSELGFEVTAVESAARALDVIREGRAADILVTDIVMPGMDGWTLAERVRDGHPEMPVLYITGFYDDAARPEPKSSLLRKPFTAESFGRALTALL